MLTFLTFPCYKKEQYISTCTRFTVRSVRRTADLQDRDAGKKNILEKIALREKSYSHESVFDLW